MVPGVGRPATGLLMSAVPMDKAGAGSTVDDTNRELGGALGIAVFGTTPASPRASTMRSTVASR